LYNSEGKKKKRIREERYRTVLKKILTDRKVLHLKNGGKVEKNDGRRRKERGTKSETPEFAFLPHHWSTMHAFCMYSSMQYSKSHRSVSWHTSYRIHSARCF
jgi:CRISPR/Cas system-associated endonuclease Cas1